MSWRPPVWDAEPQVQSPAGRPIEAQLALRPRRQRLDGFDPVYSDVVDYIIRCTHRIWEEKNIGLCRTHYAPDVVMHMAAGPGDGIDAVVDGTVGALAAYADRHVVGEDVIWSEDAAGLFHSSHRITSAAVHLGDEANGAATLAAAGVTTIADCLCRDNRIVEEWLVRDNIAALVQIGGDPWAVARAQAAADTAGDPARHGWRALRIAAVRAAAWAPPAADHPAAAPAEALRRALIDDLYGEAARAFSPAAEITWPTGRHGHGRGFWIGCTMQLRGALHRPALALDHFAARPLPGGDIAVALRWWLAGVHGGGGVWGPAGGRELLLLGISHYRLRGGAIVEDRTIFDELAVLRQVAGGLGG